MELTTGINHVATLTSDLDRLEEFYATVLGARTLFDLRDAGVRHAMIMVGSASGVHAFEVDAAMLPDGPHPTFARDASTTSPSPLSTPPPSTSCDGEPRPPALKPRLSTTVRSSRSTSTTPTAARSRSAASNPASISPRPHQTGQPRPGGSRSSGSAGCVGSASCGWVWST